MRCVFASLSSGHKLSITPADLLPASDHGRVVVSGGVSKRARTDGSVAIANEIVKQRSSAKSSVQIARQVVHQRNLPNGRVVEAGDVSVKGFSTNRRVAIGGRVVSKRSIPPWRC